MAANGPVWMPKATKFIFFTNVAVHERIPFPPLTVFTRHSKWNRNGDSKRDSPLGEQQGTQRTELICKTFHSLG